MIWGWVLEYLWETRFYKCEKHILLLCPFRLLVRTSLFHGEETGSIPVGDSVVKTSWFKKNVFFGQSAKLVSLRTAEASAKHCLLPTERSASLVSLRTAETSVVCVFQQMFHKQTIFVVHAYIWSEPS